MKIERAIEILNPEHREHYDSIETVSGCWITWYAVCNQPTGCHCRNRRGWNDN